MFVVLTAVAAVSSATLAICSWRRRLVPGAAFFSAMMLGATVWCAAYVGELSSSPLHVKTTFARLAYLGIATVPPSWLLFCLSYTGRLRRRTFRVVAPFYVVPAATLLFVAPGAAVPLVWARTSIVTSDGMRVLAERFGPWFWVHTAYSYGCLGLGSAVRRANSASKARRFGKRVSASVRASEACDSISTAWSRKRRSADAKRLCVALFVSASRTMARIRASVLHAPLPLTSC